MGSNDIYIINITGELLMCLILLIMLFTCFLQRKRLKTIQALMYIIIADIFLLVCQIFEWVFMLESLNEPAGMVPTLYILKKFAYTLDYSFYYFVSVAFFYYIRVHINDIKAKSQKEESFAFRWVNVLIIWGFVITAIFFALMNTDWFYYLTENNKEMFSPYAYGIMYFLGTFATFLSLFSIIRNRKVLGRINFGLLFAYIITPYIFVVPDLLKGTCLSYLMLSVFTFVLYIHMDLRRENEMAQNEERLIRQEKELSELNTQIMLSQMQPHFLYNTFSTISGLCYMEGATGAKQVVDKFAEYIRENLDAMGKEKFISFEKELKHIETYLWIEQVRFEGALNVEYDIEVSDFKVPSLSIQPLVENAVKHGIRKKKGGGTVTVSTREFPKEYRIKVLDDGAGFEENEILDDKRSHVGIKNTRKRLEMLCGGTCEIHSTKGKGTTVTIHIPRGE